MSSRLIYDNGKYKEWLNTRMSLTSRLHAMGAKFKQPIGFEAEQRILELEGFATDCADNFDCDVDAHKYNTPCRACEAGKLMERNSL